MKRITRCPVCYSQLDDWVHDVDGRDCDLFDCPQCGDFIATMECIGDLPSYHRDDAERQARISYALRKASRHKTRQVISSELAGRFAKTPLPRPKEQADNLLRWLGEGSGNLGRRFSLNPKSIKAICGTLEDEGFQLILDHLQKRDLIDVERREEYGEQDHISATLTFEGWEYFESLVLGKGVYGRGFMAMKFGDPVLDGIVENSFMPMSLQAGFDLSRLSDRPKAGIIDNRMRVEIQNSDFVVADLSHDNAGAYWEAGYAEGLGKPVFFTCEKEKFNQEKTHFDTNHHYTVVWDAENPEKAGEELKLAIRATLPHLAKMEG